MPKWIKDTYIDLMRNTNQLDVTGKRNFIFYNSSKGYVSNLEKHFETFNLCRKKTKLFTMDSNNVIFG